MRIRSLESGKNNEQLIAYIAPIIIMIAIVYLMVIGFFKYDTNDDFFLYLFTSGALGEYVSYSAYNNIFMSAFFASVSKCLKNFDVNWNTVYYFAGILLSYTFFSAWLSKKKGLRGVIEGVVFFIMSVGTIMNSHNFSKTGALVMIVGAIVFASYTKDDFIGWKIVSVALLVSGSLYRNATTKAVIPFVFLCFMYGLIKNKKDKVVKQYVARWVVVMGGILFLWLGDYWFYNVNPQMTEYTAFNLYRTDITDYGMADWDSHQKEYEAIGWSANDCQNLSEWNFADKTTYTVESLEVVSQIGRDTRSFLSIRRMGRMVIDLLLSIPATLLLCVRQPIFWGIIIELILSLLANKWNCIWCLGVLAFVGGELLMLQYAGRTPERAIMIPLICGFAVVCMLESKSMPLGLELIFVSIAFIACGVYKYPSMGRTEMPVQGLMNECLENMSSKSDCLYIWDIFTFAENAEKAYGPFDIVEEGYLSNSTFLGGWIIPTPVYIQKADEFGAQGNMIELLANNDNVYYVSKDEPSTSLLLYIEEHYGKRVEPSVVEDRGRFRIYSFGE